MVTISRGIQVDDYNLIKIEVNRTKKKWKRHRVKVEQRKLGDRFNN